MQKDDKSLTRVLVTESEVYSENISKHFPKSWNITFKRIMTQEQLRSEIDYQSYDIIFAKLGLRFCRELFDKQSKLKILATPTTGLDHIDLVAAEAAGVEVISLRGERDFLKNVTSTAEHAWALLLSINRSLLIASARVNSNQWNRQGMQIHELSGSTLGIIGMGRLGSIVARYGVAFNMSVSGYDPNVGPEKFPVGCRKLDFVELLASSQYIIILASYVSDDQPIIGRRELNCCRSGTVIINVARGELIDEAAILEALDNGTLRAFGTDVLKGDSSWNSINTVHSEIIDRSRRDSRILITPHMGGYAAEAIEKTRHFLINKVVKHSETMQA